MATTQLEEPLLPMSMPRPRPTQGDMAILSAASARLAKHVASEEPDMLSGGLSIEELTADIESVAKPNMDGSELARELGRRGYSDKATTVAVLDEWNDSVRATLDEAVRKWVLETAPPPPFEGIVHASVKRRWFGTSHGIAYRTAERDAHAGCLFVPDDEIVRHSERGYLNGGILVDWEDLIDIVPASPEHVDLLRKTVEHDRENEERWARARKVQDKRNAYQSRCDAFAKTPPDVAALKSSLERTLELARCGSFDPLSDEAARLVGQLQGLAERACRNVD